MPRRERRRDLARDREDLAPLLEREIGRDQRAAPLARLDDDASPAQRPAMIRLRAGNRHGAGSTPGAYSETTSPRSRILRSELRVRARVVAVDAAAEHGDRHAAGLERAAVRLAVDPAREAADDDQPGAPQARGRACARPGRRSGEQARAPTTATPSAAPRLGAAPRRKSPTGGS